MKKRFLHKLISTQILWMFVIYTGLAQNLEIKKPGKVNFKTQMQSSTNFVDINGAKELSMALIYFAIVVGSISVLHAFLLRPDKVKKRLINWTLGIFIAAVIYNVL